jgi:amino acid transporter
MMALPGPDSVSREGIYGLRDGAEEGRAAGTAAAQGGQQGSSDQLRGLAALSLDALSSVAYGPQAIVLVLVAAGTAALRLTLPVTLAIAGLLAVLVISYCQVIAVHPDGGGAYAVGKRIWGPRSACWRPRAWWWTTC